MRLLPREDAPLPGIEHVVVLMFENRSFDNVLGRLSPAPPGFEGVPSDAFNIYDDGAQTFRVAVTDEPPSGRSPFITPYPDPGESYDDMRAQIFNGKSAADMSGFAQNYADIGLTGARVPGDIMVCLSPRHMAVSNLLASRFAVCDRWFASGPVQTFPNRMFCHCATPGTRHILGYAEALVNDIDYVVRLSGSMNAVAGAVTDRSLFELLDRGGDPDPANWKIYFHDVPMSIINSYVNEAWKTHSPCMAAFDHARSDYDPPHGTSFIDDVKQGRLPAYSFIEPRYFSDYSGSGLPPNSNHPGPSAYLGLGPGAPIDVRDGEDLLADVFLALAADPDLFDKTLLIVTYDEHGGLYDHVPPPENAVSPFAGRVRNFDYTRLGVRVPTFFINPRIAPNRLYPPRDREVPFEHTSIIATLCAQFGLAGPLTPRDAAAPLLTGLIGERADEERMAAVLTQLETWRATRVAAAAAPAPRLTAGEHEGKLAAYVQARHGRR